ncbi:hypothetical protein BA190_09390 [Labrys sp. WJW]|uniref:hypothetical protein n=1 Tax=Labrys sp. WJW TaxID=1737983 RepID=UPI00082C1881|nr:hypothetical protein [Labrys sp. WJW]OCC05119.1 hypothetical protein BA190_09390 [Labrys sp. WJW]
MSSIIAFAAGVSLTYALRGRTLADNDVTFAPQNPLGAVLDGVRIAVFGGEDGGKACGRDMLAIDRLADISIHVHLPADKVVVEGTPLAVRNSASDLVYALVWRQITRALDDDTTPWGRLWKLFTVGVKELTSRPFIIETEKGVRVQAREYILTVELIADPQFGEIDPATPWGEFLDAMRAEPDMQPFADLMQRAIESPADIPEWEEARYALGLTSEAIHGIGLGRLQPPDSAAITQWTVEDAEAGDLVIADSTPAP